MNKSLYELVQKKFITEDEALEVSNSPSELQLMLKGAYHGMN
jgi:Tfp pilus assembly ATPase PilU